MDGSAGIIAGESISAPLTVGFDRRLKLQFHGAKLSSDGGLIVFRELDDALGLTEMASWDLRDNRTGRNSRHELAAMFRQSLFGRVAGYEDVNDAGRLARDPVMRLITGQRNFDRHARSIILQQFEVAVPRDLWSEMLATIGLLKAKAQAP